MEGPLYTLYFDNIQDTNVADTYGTLAAIIVPDTLGMRGQLCGFVLSCAADAAVDEAFSVKVKRINDVSGGAAGTSTAVAAANIGKQRSNDAVPDVTGAVAYTAGNEPTVYETADLYNSGLFDRGQCSFWWPGDTGPEAFQDQHIGLLLTPRSAGPTQMNWCGSLFYKSTS